MMRPPLYKIFLVYYLISFALVSQGQDYLTHQECFSVEQGLSNRFVRSILQDYRGFIWVATNYGLNRFDGQHFEVFTKEENQLQHNYINNLYEDADSLIWLAYSNNNHDKASLSFIDLLNVNTLKVKPIQELIQLPFSLEKLHKIYSLPSNKHLYLSTFDGEIYVYKGQNKFELFYRHDKNVKIIDFIEGDSYYWLIAAHEIIVLDKKCQLIARKAIDSTANLNRCNIIGERNSNSIWVLLHYLHGNLKKSWICQVDSTLQESHPLDSFMANTRMAFNTKHYHRPTKKSSIFINRRQMAFFDRSGKSIYHYSLPGVYFGVFYIDHQENVWTEMNQGGLCKFSYSKNKFTPFFKQQPIRGITYTAGDSILLANSYQGFQQYHFASNKSSLSNGLGLDLLKSRDGKRLWISSEYNYIEEYDSKNLSLKKVYDFYAKEKEKITTPMGLEPAISWALHEDKKGRLWLGSSSGLAYLEASEDSLRYFDQFNEFTNFSTALVNYLYENNQGLWAATSLGLYLIDEDKGILRKYATDSSSTATIPHDYILSFHEDHNGLFWLATRGGGVIQFDPQTGHYEQFTTRQGLSHNVVYAILEDDQHYLWMSSDYGLMRFHPQTKIVNTYLPRDGLLHEEFNHTAAYRAPDGQFYFGGVAGLVGFNPNNFLHKEAYQAPLQITRYQYFDDSKSIILDKTQALIQNPSIVLNYTDRFFILDFALLDYNTNPKNQYAYKIEGLDKEWHYINNNSIRINGLTAGQYTLHIKGQGNNGIWSSSQLHIPILVKQPFYLTWQFFLALIGLVFAYFYWRVIRFRKAKERLETEVKKRTKKIQEQANKLRELDTLKSKFFANISHELRTPLTLIFSPINAILEKHYGNDLSKIMKVLEVAKRNGHKLQNLIEEILLLSKHEASRLEIESQEIALAPLLRQIFGNFESQAHLQGIHFELQHQLPEQLVVGLDRSKFEKIINNLLSNALKYTPRAGHILLQVEHQIEEVGQLKLVLSVVDSGQGIYPEDLPYIFDRFYQSKHKEAIVQGGTGIGLALAYQFAQLLGGELSVESTLGKGTTFKLSLPLKIVATTVLQEKAEELALDLAFPLPFVQKKQAHTILLVEDNDDMRHFILDLLSNDYRILPAENGKIALDLLEQQGTAIDLVLSDVMMPELDGFELLQKIKAHSDWRQLPVVMLTARAAEQDKLQALRIGVDDYIPKPFSHQELLVRIHNLLQNYQQRKTWQQTSDDWEEVSLEVLPPAEEKDEWLEQLERITKRQIGNSQFGVLSLAYDMQLSERHLRRKIKAKTGLSPSQYFRLIKLDIARQYLESKKYTTVAEVAKKIAFSNVNYFSQIYFEQYGKKPIEYLRD